MGSLHGKKVDDHDLGFRLLVLPDDHKRILESQIREHFRKRVATSSSASTEDDMDLVRGKGQGLIILVHGKLWVNGEDASSRAMC